VAGEVEGHYERLAGRFEENWAYSAHFVAWMSGCITGRLDPRPGDRVADIGCGTGLYARGLAERAGRVVCVDPSAAMLAQLPAAGVYVPVRASIEEMASGAVALPHDRFDAVLVKEALHHAADRLAALEWLAALIAPGGRLLIAMLPPTLDYPLFEAALQRYQRHPSEPCDVAGVLTGLGLEAEVSQGSYRLEIPKARWLAMVADRYMSLLSKFGDEELRAGIAEIDARYPGPVLEFQDRFVFVLARREAQVKSVA
jgi:SAM-dependent methyltransferase